MKTQKNPLELIVYSLLFGWLITPIAEVIGEAIANSAKPPKKFERREVE